MSPGRTIDIVLPVHNDWEAFLELLPELDGVVGGWEEAVRVRVVDDGSTEEPPDLADRLAGLRHIREVRVTRLVSNLGHQRAIAVGLAEACRSGEAPDAVIVMDCDGEDRPADAEGLREAFLEEPDRIVVARRARRSESLWFRMAYRIYRLLFLVLTGRRIDFGNFLLVPRRFLETLAHSPSIWNHVAAAVVRLGLPIRRVSSRRGERYAGRSGMKPITLVTHGLSAMSVFSDHVFVRVLLFSTFLSVATAAGIVAVVGIRLFTDLAIPGWATNAAGLLFIIFLQALVLSAAAAVLLLNSRSTESIIPALDAQRHVRGRFVPRAPGADREGARPEVGAPGEPPAPSGT